MKAKISIKRLLSFLLMAMLTLGVSCKKDDDADDDMDKKYYVIELNKDDHRFESLPTINRLYRVYYGNRLVDMLIRDDSIFISYYGVLLYPTKLPDSFSIMKGVSSFFSGEVKQKPQGTDYYPIVLTEFKYKLPIQF